MSRQKMGNTGQDRLILWKIGAIAGIVLYVATSFIFIYYGTPNADEGWYLLAGRRVLQGQFPYIDFAFTQMPLLPYIYGIPQAILGSSIMLGRITSVALSLATFGIWLHIARKRTGIVGLSATALLLATFTYGLYYNSIVKTYALVSLLFALTFYFMTSDDKKEWMALAAAVAALGSTMARLSALPFTLVIVAYLFVTSPSRRVKWGIVILSLLIVIGFLSFASLDMQSARWNLVTHHTGQWGMRSNTEKLTKILFERAPEVLISFLPYMALFFLSIVLFRGKAEKMGEFRQKVLVFVVGVSLFGFSHFAAGGWGLEYFVPAIYSLLPILGMLFGHTYGQQRVSIKHSTILRVVLFSVLISEAIRGGWQFFDYSGGQSPMAEIRKAANYVESHTSASERLIAFEALWIAIDSNRQVPTGMTMAQFSLYDGDADKAQQLKLVNSDLVLHHLSSGTAKIVAFTDSDWRYWQRFGISDQINGILEECYETSLLLDNFGQHANQLTLYTWLDSC